MEDSIKKAQPNDYTQYPESSIRKYRAAYAGTRTSQQFNLIEQEIISDIYFIYNQLNTCETNKDSLYLLTDIFYPEGI